MSGMHLLMVRHFFIDNIFCLLLLDVHVHREGMLKKTILNIVKLSICIYYNIIIDIVDLSVLRILEFLM
jgi:hypothetical protein